MVKITRPIIYVSIAVVWGLTNIMSWGSGYELGRKDYSPSKVEMETNDSSYIIRLFNEDGDTTGTCEFENGGLEIRIIPYYSPFEKENKKDTSRSNEA